MRVAGDELRRLGLGDVRRGGVAGRPRVVRACERLLPPHGHHPDGHRPREQRRRSDGGVHGVDGLFVAGSSVFPAAGFANPTLLIVSLAIRLGDHLKHALDRLPSATA